MDQCKHCQLRGDMLKCYQEDCTTHESWYAKELIKHIEELQNTSSNSDYPKCEFCEDQTEVHIKRGLHLVRKPCPFCSNLNEETKPTKETK